MKILKIFEDFNSSSIEYIKSILSKFELEYEEDVDDGDGNLCIKAIFNDKESNILDTFYIFASHSDKEYATYHIKFLVNGKLEDEYSTPNLKGSITSMIESSYEKRFHKNIIKPKDLVKGDKIIIHKPSQNGEGINTPVTFVKYNKWWDWIVAEKDGKEFKVGISQDQTEDDIFIEKVPNKK